MKVEFNTNGFKAEMSSPFEDGNSKIDLTVSSLWSGAAFFNVTAFIVGLFSLLTTLACQFGINLLSSLLSVEAGELSIWLFVISLFFAAGACFFAVWATRLGYGKITNENKSIEYIAFNSAMSFINVGSYIIIALCVIINIVFTIA